MEKIIECGCGNSHCRDKVTFKGWLPEKKANIYTHNSDVVLDRDGITQLRDACNAILGEHTTPETAETEGDTAETREGVYYVVGERVEGSRDDAIAAAKEACLERHLKGDGESVMVLELKATVRAETTVRVEER